MSQMDENQIDLDREDFFFKIFKDRVEDIRRYSKIFVGLERKRLSRHRLLVFFPRQEFSRISGNLNLELENIFYRPSNSQYK